MPVSRLARNIPTHLVIPGRPPSVKTGVHLSPGQEVPTPSARSLWDLENIAEHPACHGMVSRDKRGGWDNDCSWKERGEDFNKGRHIMWDREEETAACSG